MGWADGFGSVFHFVPPSSFSKFSDQTCFALEGWVGGWVFGSKVPLVIFLTFPFLFNPVYASASLVKKKTTSFKEISSWLVVDVVTSAP